MLRSGLGRIVPTQPSKAGRIRWRRAAVSGAAAALVIALALATPVAIHAFREFQQHRASQPDPIPATDEEQKELLRVLLRENGYFGLPPPPPEPGEIRPEPRPPSVVLLDTSIAICPDELTAPDPGCSSPPRAHSIAASDFDREIPRKLRLELIAANRSRTSVPDPAVARAIYRPRSSVQQALRGPGWWGGFYAAFPDAGGFLEVSRAVMSEDRRHALIYAGHFCGGLCGSGTLYYLERTGNTWRTVTSAGVWIS